MTYLTIWFNNGQLYEFIGASKINEDKFGNLTFEHMDRVTGKTGKASFDLTNVAGYSYTKGDG